MKKLLLVGLVLAAMGVMVSILLVGCFFLLGVASISSMTPEERTAWFAESQQRAAERKENREAEAEERALQRAARDQREQDAGQDQPRSTEWVLRTPSNNPVPVTVSRDAYDQMMKFSTAGDVYGIQQLMNQGLVFEVRTRTPVIRLSGLITCEVRITRGVHANQVVWVAGDFLKRP